LEILRKMKGGELEAIRRHYAEEVCETAGVRSPRLVDAFAAVPRERHLGPGPWKIFDLRSFRYCDTTDAEPTQVYRDVLVAIEPARLLNNGQPSLHAQWISELDVRSTEHVVHVGSGTGYYTAILAELVGPQGRVTAIEVDASLAKKAREMLATYPQVEVIIGDGGEHDFGPVNAVYVNGGATHPRRVWLDRLLPGGRLLVPLVRWPGDPSESSLAGWGITLHVRRMDDGSGSPRYGACLGSTVGIFPCIGAVDAEADRLLRGAFGRGLPPERVRSLRVEPHDEAADCWLHGDGYCLSLRSPAPDGSDAAGGKCDTSRVRSRT
jgi:protein-L-isoaspartate(D-aspartate) O-methyltransferase